MKTKECFDFLCIKVEELAKEKTMGVHESIIPIDPIVSKMTDEESRNEGFSSFSYFGKRKFEYILEDGRIEVFEAAEDRCKPFVVRPDGVNIHVKGFPNQGEMLVKKFYWVEKPGPGEKDD
jgi:hypothetical protein